MSGRGKKKQPEHPSKKKISIDRDEAATGGDEAIEHTSGGGGRRGMDQNMIGLLIGCVGAAMTLLAYQQTVVSTTQCMGGGLVVLMVALCVKEGFFSF